MKGTEDNKRMQLKPEQQYVTMDIEDWHVNIFVRESNTFSKKLIELKN
jgi:hypothetical protein